MRAPAASLLLPANKPPCIVCVFPVPTCPYPDRICECETERISRVKSSTTNPTSACANRKLTHDAAVVALEHLAQQLLGNLLRARGATDVNKRRAQEVGARGIPRTPAAAWPTRQTSRRRRTWIAARRKATRTHRGEKGRVAVSGFCFGTGGGPTGLADHGQAVSVRVVLQVAWRRLRSQNVSRPLHRC